MPTSQCSMTEGARRLDPRFPRQTNVRSRATTLVQNAAKVMVHDVSASVHCKTAALSVAFTGSQRGRQHDTGGHVAQPTAALGTVAAVGRGA